MKVDKHEFRRLLQELIETTRAIMPFEHDQLTPLGQSLRMIHNGSLYTGGYEFAFDQRCRRCRAEKAIAAAELFCSTEHEAQGTEHD